MNSRPDVAVLTWDPVCQRSQSIARHLGTSLQTIHYLWYRRPWIAPLKYVLQAVATFVWLRRTRPRVTMVSNPPPFSALTVWLYCRLFGGGFVVDAHTGVFLEPKWRPFRPLNRFLMRRASLTLVTNAALKEIVERWGGRGFVLPDPLPEMHSHPDGFVLDPSRFNVAVICSFYEDEPIDVLLALRSLPQDMHLYVTGDSSRLPAQVRMELSPQVTLTGFIERSQYESLLCRCDAVMVLCTRPHTLLCGAYEAVAAGKPLVTSESDAMRAYFRRGTVFVANTTADIETGLRVLRHHSDTLGQEVRELARILRTDWRKTFSQCLEQMETGRSLAHREPA